MAETQLIRCASCGASNRVPVDKLRSGLQPVCGRCKAPLAPGAHPLTVTDASFDRDVAGSPEPVLLDMWAPWCGPCRSVAPIVDQLASELAGKIRVAKLNVDENPITASRFAIQGIPALLVLKGGREVDRIVGAQPKAAILRRLQPYLA